ncbi:MAG: DNA-directed RNA polymerase subunit alpha, partial [Planctomycetota bacterium]
MHIRWRGLELPGSVVPDLKTISGTYGKFTAEPFERGFGTTVGNSLRRLLLSSLEGSAITQIKVGGALHEFTTIKGVLEDISDIVLNVKSLVVKNHSDSTRVIRVEKNTRGPVTGADVQTDEAVEVFNKDLVIATLTDDVPFELEMVVENGRGYVPASEHSQETQEIGIIPVDAIFSPVTRVRYEVEETRVGQKTNYDRLTMEIWTPVTRVRYEVEETRVGQKTNYDRLTMEIWTNGTVTPEMALVEAAKILRKHLSPFVGYTRPGPSVNLPAAGSLFAVEAPLESRLSMLVSDLKLSLRANNCLDTAGISLIRDLVSRSREELLEVRNFGETT